MNRSLVDITRVLYSAILRTAHIYAKAALFVEALIQIDFVVFATHYIYFLTVNVP